MTKLIEHENLLTTRRDIYFVGRILTEIRPPNDDDDNTEHAEDEGFSMRWQSRGGSPGSKIAISAAAREVMSMEQWQDDFALQVRKFVSGSSFPLTIDQDFKTGSTIRDQPNTQLERNPVGVTLLDGFHDEPEQIPQVPWHVRFKLLGNLISTEWEYMRTPGSLLRTTTTEKESKQKASVNPEWKSWLNQKRKKERKRDREPPKRDLNERSIIITLTDEDMEELDTDTMPIYDAWSSAILKNIMRGSVTDSDVQVSLLDRQGLWSCLTKQESTWVMWEWDDQTLCVSEEAHLERVFEERIAHKVDVEFVIRPGEPDTEQISTTFAQLNNTKKKRRDSTLTSH
ncbi:hypothetical protein PRZ48_008049 [Zasmidium cellare]|uniref:Uncharacterized protein n=1 Tax=Zasmidium cellare TaxID=395010 RepID=A0ABR0EF86_ZASCE|nr:hypothetical protein PRZ48_008049 [Zasmidium cellare]